VKRGLIAAGGGLFRLPQRIPYHQAMQLILEGDMLEAPRAAELGLVNVLTEPGGALAAALELAERIAQNAPLAVRAAKQIVVASGSWPASEAFERQRPIYEPIRSSEDAREGATAFAEKRAPVWRGR
jgi:enoyl-CoA hydratase